MGKISVRNTVQSILIASAIEKNSIRYIPSGYCPFISLTGVINESATPPTDTEIKIYKRFSPTVPSIKNSKSAPTPRQATASKNAPISFSTLFLSFMEKPKV